MARYKIEVLEYRRTGKSPLDGYQVLVYNGKLKKNIWFWYNVRNNDIESCDLDYQENYNDCSITDCDSVGLDYLESKGIFIRDKKGNWSYPDQIVPD